MATAVGLDLGSQAVRAAAVDTRPSPPALRRFAQVPLPPGAVVAGEVVDEGAVEQALRALWKRHRLPRKGVVIGMAGRPVAVRAVEVPDGDEAELAAAVAGRLEGLLPWPTGEAVVDFVPLDSWVQGPGERLRSVLAVAARRPAVEGLLRLARRAGVQVASVDLQAFGLVRAALGSSPAADQPGVHGLLDIGATLTQIALAHEGCTRWVHFLDAGGNDFTEALVAGASLPPEEAEQKKRSVGVAALGVPPGGGEEGALRRLLTGEADRLIELLRGPIDGYLAEAGQGALVRLVVAGNGARLPHLASRIGRALGARVEPARILDRITVGRVGLTEPQLLDLQPVLPAAVGLALWGRYAVSPGGLRGPAG